jgi:hypothetical protein
MIAPRLESKASALAGARTAAIMVPPGGAGSAQRTLRIAVGSAARTNGLAVCAVAGIMTKARDLGLPIWQRVKNKSSTSVVVVVVVVVIVIGEAMHFAVREHLERYDNLDNDNDNDNDAIGSP